MTDTEQERIKAICKVAHVDDIGDLSDGYHTFKQLYYQRMMLFAVLVKQNRYKSWKSLRHEDGELCFGGGWFIVGIDTPKGSYTYHYEDNYFSLFDCVELERGKTWDGHTEKDITRLLSLEQEPCNDCISRQAALDLTDELKDDLPDDDRLSDMVISHNEGILEYQTQLSLLPSVQPKQEKSCKNCKHSDKGMINTESGRCKVCYHDGRLGGNCLFEEQPNQRTGADVLDKIEAEIKAIAVNGQVDEHTMFIRTGDQVKQVALEIIDKYKVESEG